jgi:hypothetical protein
MSIYGPGTSETLLADARARGYQVTPRLITEWVRRGLLDRPVRRGKGQGRGTTKGEFPRSQRELFLALLDKRAQGATHFRSLSQIPIFTWLYFGDAYVPTRQIVRALASWVGDASSSYDRARETADEIIALHDHPDARPADRRRLRTLLIDTIQSGRLRDRAELLDAVRQVFEPEKAFGNTFDRAIGHPDTLLTSETIVLITEARAAAIAELHAVTAEGQDEQTQHRREQEFETLLRLARQDHLFMHADYLQHLREYQDQATGSLAKLFPENSPQRQFDTAAHDLLTALGRRLTLSPPT